MNAIPRRGAIALAPDQIRPSATVTPEHWRLEEYPVVDELVTTGVISEKFARWAWDPALNASNRAPRVMDLQKEVGEAAYAERYRQLTEIGKREGAYDLIHGQYNVLIPRPMETKLIWPFGVTGVWAKTPRAIGSAVLDMEGGEWRTTAKQIMDKAGEETEECGVYASRSVSDDSLDALLGIVVYHGRDGEYSRTTPRPVRLPAGHLLPLVHESGEYPPYDYLFMPTLGQQG